MKKISLLFILHILFFNVYSQSNKRTFQFGDQLDKVKIQQEIVFFGYDMSSIKCTVKQHDMSDFALCTRIPGELINWLHAQYGINKIRKGIGVKKLIFENAAVQLRLKDLDQNCLTTEMYVIDESKLKDIIRSYVIPAKYDG